MFTLKSAAREILAYVSLKPKEQTEYFMAAREITDAQFCLANRLKRFVATILVMLAEKKGGGGGNSWCDVPVDERRVAALLSSYNNRGGASGTEQGGESPHLSRDCSRGICLDP